METRANYVLIGVFTLAVVVGVFAFVWWFQRLGTGEAKTQFEIYFDSPVSGLRRGATVNFNGIRVGEVQSLALVPDVPKAAVAIVEITANTPVRTDTKVTLEYQGLTGLASVALTGGSPEASMLKQVKRGERPARLYATNTTDAFQAARDLMIQLQEVVKKNEANIAQLIDNLTKVSGVLSARSNDTLLEVQAAAESIRKAADNIGNQSAPAINEFRSLATDARRAVGEIDRLVRNIERNPRQFLFNNGGTVPQYNR
jgi:phospholipid/cholesterol/gamma-HCH transport system substrate-binding protein